MEQPLAQDESAAGYDSELVAEFYDYIPRYLARGDVRFYAEVARRYGETVLEIGCGTGRILLPIASSGARVVGIDASEAMLARARQRVDDAPEDVRARVEALLRRDALDLSGLGRFS